MKQDPSCYIWNDREGWPPRLRWIPPRSHRLWALPSQAALEQCALPRCSHDDSGMKRLVLRLYCCWCLPFWLRVALGSPPLDFSRSRGCQAFPLELFRAFGVAKAFPLEFVVFLALPGFSRAFFFNAFCVCINICTVYAYRRLGRGIPFPMASKSACNP